MKKKVISLLVLLTLLLTSSIVWADATDLSKFTPVKFSITPDTESLVVKYDNAVFISGYKGKDTYLLKCDTQLKVLWELKISSLVTEAEIYGGYLYAVSPTNIMKISLDGKLVWDIKIPLTNGRFSPVELTVVGTQIFINAFQHMNADTYISSVLCSTDGKAIVGTTFKNKTNSCGNNYYYQGAFFFDSGNEHYVSTTDNKKFKDVTLTAFNSNYSEKKRIDPNLYCFQNTEGNNKTYSVSDRVQTLVATLPGRLGEIIALDSHTIFGLQLDDRYQAQSFSLVKGINYLEEEVEKSLPLILSANALKNIVNAETMKVEIDKAVNQYYKVLGSRTSSANSISLLFERAVSKLASQTVASGATIDKAILNNALSTYANTSQVNNGLVENVFYTRGIKKFITFNLENSDAMVTLSNDLYSNEIDGIIINAPEMSLTITSETLKEINKYENLNFQFSKKDTLPSLSISQKLKNPIIIGIPTTLKSTDSLTIFDGKGVNIGGRYNPVTGQLETRVKTGGLFTVKNGSKAFTDITLQNDAIQNAINVLAAKGIMSGKSETKFNPDAPITRAEIAGIMLNLTCLLEDGQSIFSDVKSTDWYYDIASSAKLNGIMSGTTSTAFSPKALITKEQLITILSAKLQKDSKFLNPGTFRTYSDYSDKNLVSDWAQGHFAFAGYENLLISTNDSYLDPKANLTRGETAQLIYEFYKNW